MWIIARQMMVILNTISFDRRFGLSSVKLAAASGCSSDSWRNIQRLKSCRALWQICCTYLASELHTYTQHTANDQQSTNTPEYEMKYNAMQNTRYIQTVYNCDKFTAYSATDDEQATVYTLPPLLPSPPPLPLPPPPLPPPPPPLPPYNHRHHHFCFLFNERSY